MALIEICDICEKKLGERDSISIKASDMNGLGFIGNLPIRTKRNYMIRICDECIKNIKAYCKKIKVKY